MALTKRLANGSKAKEFSLGVNKMNKIRIYKTNYTRCEFEMHWRRDAGYTGQRILNMELPGRDTVRTGMNNNSCYILDKQIRFLIKKSLKSFIHLYIKLVNYN